MGEQKEGVEEDSPTILPKRRKEEKDMRGLG
jgi:hypothetical protein